MFIITKPNSKIRLPGHLGSTPTYQQNWNYTKIKSFHYRNYDINNTQLSESLVYTLERYGLRALPWTSCLNFTRLCSIELQFYRGADTSLARPGRKQANVSVRMAWISFDALPWKKNLTARVSMLLKSRASLTCFRACFLPGRAKDLSAPPYNNTAECHSRNACARIVTTIFNISFIQHPTTRT